MSDSIVFDKTTAPITISFDDEVRWILGQPNFACAAIFRRLRALGHEIPFKAEEEQAYSLFWMLSLYVEHGAGWREEAERILHEPKEESGA